MIEHGAVATWIAGPVRRVGVSLKMYMDHRRTMQWLTEVAALPLPAEVELFVIPDFLSLYPAAALLGAGPVRLGAQDVFWEDQGAYTGEISAPMLAAAGCRYVEIGHAERRALFAESDAVIAAKAAAATRSGLIPLLCVGEPLQAGTEAAIAFCRAQIAAVLAAIPEQAELMVAYEPVWAIGAAEPAGAEHIRAVSQGLRECLQGRRASLIYGGSAGPGLFQTLDGHVDGLFLGRFAHDSQALLQVLQEVAAAVQPA